MRFKGWFGIAAATAMIGMAAGAAQAQTLYDGSLLTLPSAQGWLSYNSVGSATQTNNAPSPNVTVNTSGSASNYAGYSNDNLSGSLVNSAFPTLNSTAGFTLNFTAQVTSDIDSYNSAHPRAAFSVILLDSNHTGIEIGLRTDGIFAQASSFGTPADYDATSFATGMNSYSLAISGTTYTLSSGGDTLLTGATTQYTSIGDPAAQVYSKNNFLFLGDDTTADGGSFTLGYVGLTAAPEPTSIALAAAGFGAVGVVARRRRRTAL